MKLRYLNHQQLLWIMGTIGVAAYEEVSQKSCTLFVGCPAFFHTDIRSLLIQPFPHNTFCLPPPQLCINYCFQILLEDAVLAEAFIKKK